MKCSPYTSCPWVEASTDHYVCLRCDKQKNLGQTPDILTPLITFLVIAIILTLLMGCSVTPSETTQEGHVRIQVLGIKEGVGEE